MRGPLSVMLLPREVQAAFRPRTYAKSSFTWAASAGETNGHSVGAIAGRGHRNRAGGQREADGAGRGGEANLSTLAGRVVLLLFQRREPGPKFHERRHVAFGRR